MDKSALKDKRRETVIGLLKGMSIRKDTDGGFEKDDVYGCIQELCNLYEDHITELENNYEAEISELTKRYQKYDENNELYVSLILEAKKSSNEIINQAKTEVDEILKNGKEKIKLQEEQLEQFRVDSEKERESIAEELKASKEVAEAEKAAMKVEMEAEKEKLEATKNKYRQQITAMEDEFAEIKTNILRTSARLDSLKAQTEELSPSIDWEVEETEIEVEVPDADVEVEEFAEAEAVLPIEEEPAEEAPEEEAPAAAVPIIDESELPEAVKSIELVLDEQFEEPVEAQVEAPAEEAPAEQAPAEEAPAEAEDLFADSFLKGDLFDIVEPEGDAVAEVEQALGEVPAEAIEPSGEHEATVEELLASMDALTDVDGVAEAAEASDGVDDLLDEISFDDLIEEGTEKIDAAAVEAAEPVAEAAEAVEAAAPEEISFDSLEALFKDEQ